MVPNIEVIKGFIGKYSILCLYVSSRLPPLGNQHSLLFIFHLLANMYRYIHGSTVYILFFTLLLSLNNIS